MTLSFDIASIPLYSNLLSTAFAIRDLISNADTFTHQPVQTFNISINQTNAMAPPIGIELFKGKTAKYKVGKKLGSGACASVHCVNENDGASTEWAIKLAPLAKKITKKKNSEAEVNERMIYFEHVMYMNQFQDLQGTIIPRLPPSKGPPGHGNAGGMFLTFYPHDVSTAFVTYLVFYGRIQILRDGANALSAH